MRRSRHAAIGATLLAIGFAACDAGKPQERTAAAPAEPEAFAEDGAFSEAVRGALAKTMRDEDPFTRALRLGALLPTLGPEAVPAVQRTLEDPAFDFGAAEIELLLRYWATYQPAEASLWAASKAPGFFRVPAVLASFSLWAEADPSAAKSAAEEWAKRRPDLRDVLPKALVRGWYAANPVELERFVHDLGPGIPRQRALATYVRIAMRDQGIDAVTRWAESLPDDDASYKRAVFDQVGSSLPLFDHDASLRWCEAHCDGPYGKNLRNVTASHWAREDGAAALEWVLAAPKTPENDFAVRVAYEEWARVDRRAAMEWVAERAAREADRSWLQPILPVYARLLAADSPAEAIEWAEQIEHENKRRYALIEIARAWRERDEAAAEAWLVESPLSDEDRERVRAAEWDRRI